LIQALVRPIVRAEPRTDYLSAAPPPLPLTIVLSASAFSLQSFARDGRVSAPSFPVLLRLEASCSTVFRAPRALRASLACFDESVDGTWRGGDAGRLRDASPRRGLLVVQELARQRVGHEVRQVRTDDDEARLQAEIAQRLAQPLTVDDAIEVALVNNRGLRATYADLGIAEADLVQAGRLSNRRGAIGTPSAATRSTSKAS